jgi:hypothetical protein
MKCKSKVDAVKIREERTSRGLRILKGECPICKTRVARILGK